MYFDEMFLQVNVTTTVLFIGAEASDVVLLIGLMKTTKVIKEIQISFLMLRPLVVAAMK
jgi:hypothetical protein